MRRREESDQPAVYEEEESFFARLDTRPILVALAGPNGAGKTTFHESHLRETGLRFLNADVFARELEIDSYAAAKILASLRYEMIQRGESFIFETVFSDPVGDKLTFLKKAIERGYTVVMCFIGITDARVSEERVAMRVSQGGHDVPTEKLISRLPCTLANLKSAMRELPHVIIFDNNDLNRPFRKVAVFEGGHAVFLSPRLPEWLRPLL